MQKESRALEVEQSVALFGAKNNMKYMPTNYKAVLYARKSNEDENKQVQSIGDQIECMKEIAKEDGLCIVEVLSESKSAKAPGKRPVFSQMMRDIEAGKYNVILTWDTSRLSRNPKDGGDIQWLVNNGTIAGIRTHEKWYHDDDDLLFTIENSMNGRFIKELRDKVKRGMDSKTDKGDYASHAPIGYRNDKESKKVVKDDVMFDRVAELWRKALTGIYSVSELTRIAKDELMIRTRITKKGGNKPLCHNAIRNMLTNPFYTGKFRWKGQLYSGNHPAMITYAQFEQMQAILNPTRHNSRPKNNLYDFILRGLLVCAECGYAIVTEKKYKKLSDGTLKEYRYCHCCGKNPEKRCKNRSVYIREDKLLEQIRDELCKYTIDEDFYKLAIEALAEEDEAKVSQQNEKINAINRQITAKTNELNGLRRSVYTGLITDHAFFLAEQESLETEIAKLESDRSKVLTIANDWREKANDIFMFARYAKEDFDSDDWERKRTVIRQLGAKLKLSGRTIVFTPVKYLVPVANYKEKLNNKKEAGRTISQQRKNSPLGTVSSSWCTVVQEVRTIIQMDLLESLGLERRLA